ncbi:hypothetical protein [Spiroplasma platyhelix]|uniref:Uncharacterized protein n=1 Tax=Spiroplasma platyhelix PALS-1 TaxID=1276218 RepID=A0A846TXC0_9MOLU|nr:hypothetical protein [Spiroplasma platyhelix]MBE4704339.1 hypothetical protein [Spiroplasma platyhelix PALS-1]NKE38711.1 hypothetical protein [Spiroplasma platyhelix PALS-1]UJB28921.1 hypothetical protein SPLAT_v1c01560 [Spiroplasma platyhelix PALS-1]
MFSKNTDNKLGVNDSKIGKNDNVDLGDNKNNQTKQKSTIKKSQLENSNNSQNYENSQNFNADRIENHYYSTARAKEDSKNEQYLTVINLKNDALKRIYEIRDTFIECVKCREIHKRDITKMLKRRAEQNNYEKDFATLYDEEWDFSIVPQLPTSVDNWLEENVKFVKQQKEFLVNYQAMKPGFYTPCKKHINLGREWYMLELQITDYNKLINK